MGAVSLGFGPGGKRIRKKVSGKTKQEVRAKLNALHQELNAGVKSSSTYTVRQTVEDRLREGLDDTSERTRALHEGLLEPVLEMIGARPLRDLSPGDVRSALGELVTRYSTRSLQITRNSLERAIRHAESNDLVGRNVAALADPSQPRVEARHDHAPDSAPYQDVAGRLYGLLIGLDDRLDREAAWQLHHFVEVGEYGLALEEIAGALAYAKVAVTDQERSDMLALTATMNMDDLLPPRTRILPAPGQPAAT
jgi:hypothetical protein